MGACVNAVDYIGRTPLHIAIMMEKVESAIVLLMEGASLRIEDSNGKKPPDYCKSKLMEYVCGRALLLHVIHFLGKQKFFYQKIKRGIIYFVENELKNNVDKELLKMIRDKVSFSLLDRC